TWPTPVGRVLGPAARPAPASPLVGHSARGRLLSTGFTAWLGAAWRSWLDLPHESSARAASPRRATRPTSPRSSACTAASAADPPQQRSNAAMTVIPLPQQAPTITELALTFGAHEIDDLDVF